MDDNEFNIYTLVKLLKIIGYEIPDENTAINGKIAYENVKSWKCKSCQKGYRLVLMDLNMPVMDGY